MGITLGGSGGIEFGGGSIPMGNTLPGVLGSTINYPDTVEIGGTPHACRVVERSKTGGGRRLEEFATQVGVTQFVVRLPASPPPIALNETLTWTANAAGPLARKPVLIALQDAIPPNDGDADWIVQTEWRGVVGG
jgi:hypothetical protein